MPYFFLCTIFFQANRAGRKRHRNGSKRERNGSKRERTVAVSDRDCTVAGSDRDCTHAGCRKQPKGRVSKQEATPLSSTQSSQVRRRLFREVS